MRDFKVDLPDGRTLRWPATATRAGLLSSLFMERRCRIAPGPWLTEPARARGVHVLAPNRPGIGGSDPHPLPLVASYVDDVTALADRLDLGRFGVVGHSGGGPFALACGALLPDRVRVVATIAGIAPLDIPGMEEGVAADDRRILRLLKEGKEGSVRRQFQVMGFAVRYVPRLSLSFFKNQVSASERELLGGVV